MSDLVPRVRPPDAGRTGAPNLVELPATSAVAATVMVIDDSPDVVAVLSRFLKNEGCVTLEAHSGIEGLSLLADHDVDLVFLDLMMPDMDGFEVFQALRSGPRNAEVPVIMMTARSDQEARSGGARPCPAAGHRGISLQAGLSQSTGPETARAASS
jgi:CheY-like chemotaxis protein